MGKNISNDNGFIRNHEGQEEVAHDVSCAKEKESPTQYPIFSINILYEWNRNQTFPDELKLRECVANRPTLLEWLKEVL